MQNRQNLSGAGLVTTITLYGLGVATIGKTASLDQFSTIMFLIAGVAGFVFGLSQLKLITIKMPTYSKTPKFIQNRGEYVKSYLMDVLLTEKPEYLEKYPIFTAPRLVIDGKFEFTGIPKKEDLKKKFS